MHRAHHRPADRVVEDLPLGHEPHQAPRGVGGEAAEDEVDVGDVVERQQRAARAGDVLGAAHLEPQPPSPEQQLRRDDDRRVGDVAHAGRPRGPVRGATAVFHADRCHDPARQICLTGPLPLCETVPHATASSRAASSSTSATTSAARSSPRPSASRPRGTRSSSSTSATRRRSASRPRRRSWPTWCTTCPSRRATPTREGIYSARTAVAQYYQSHGLTETSVEDVFIGNGVSELITLVLQAFLDDGNEILVPAPDYPLWTGAVTLSGGTPVHYRCDEENGWDPDLADIEAKITENTQGLVIINPNNPTGAVYSEDDRPGPGRHRPPAPAGGVQRRDLREDPLRRRGAPPHGDVRRRRRALPDLQRAVQGLPGLRLPRRAG